MQDRQLTAETVEDVSVDSRQEAEFDKVGIALQHILLTTPIRDVQEVADTLVQSLSVDEQQTLLRALKKRQVDDLIDTVPEQDLDQVLSPDWRDGSYPYQFKMKRASYEHQKYKLQIELLKFQAWVKETGQRVVILFEGRDAAGKGGTIKRFIEHLNPRGAHTLWHSKSQMSKNGGSGIFSVIRNTYQPVAKSFCLIARGITVQGLSESWAFVANKSTPSLCANVLSLSVI